MIITKARIEKFCRPYSLFTYLFYFERTFELLFLCVRVRVYDAFSFGNPEFEKLRLLMAVSGYYDQQKNFKVGKSLFPMRFD